MLNDYWGELGGQDTTVALDFTQNSDGTGQLVSVPFALTNGVEIRSAVDCTGGSAANPAKVCPSYDYATSSPNTVQVYSAVYTDVTAPTSYYYQTQGAIVLDALTFSIPVDDQGLWLADIRISNNYPYAGNRSYNMSRTALTAITLETSGDVVSSAADSASTPEPSTSMLFLAGIGLIGTCCYRRRLACLT
jgi:hypothetical protein